MTRTIWDLADEAQAEVDKWPDWKRRAADTALVTKLDGTKEIVMSDSYEEQYDQWCREEEERAYREMQAQEGAYRAAQETQELHRQLERSEMLRRQAEAKCEEIRGWWIESERKLKECEEAFDRMHDAYQDLGAHLDEGSLIDEDPVPEGYSIYVYSSLVMPFRDRIKATSDDEFGDPVCVAWASSYKAAARWCWAHSQGLVK